MNKFSLKRILGVLLIAAPMVTAAAQTTETLAPNRLATNLAGATTAIAPPDGFNPLGASDSDLARYGFPPRPDANLEPAAFSRWSSAMEASKIRVFPQLQMTNVFHGPAQNGVGKQVTNATSNSSNWSAIVDFSGATSYAKSKSFYYLIAQYVVPVARQAFGACTGSWDYSSSWVGIDGWGSSDVLQAGTESDAYCSGSTVSTYYSAWYEWYPYGSVRISSLPVSPGDDIFVEVWNTSATQGYAYLTNYNTNQYVQIGFTAYPGYPLVGNSAEWVVERPSVGGSLATLTNYISDYFSDAYAYTWAGSSYVPGTSGAYSVTMVDSKNYGISYPTLLGTTAIWFQNENSSRSSSLQ